MTTDQSPKSQANPDAQGPNPQAAGVHRAGFTMVEVLITIGIIVLLAGLLLGGLAIAKKRATEIRIHSDLALIGTALDYYKTDFGDYPRFDDDNSADSLNVQMDRGARLLCRALLGPAPATFTATATKLGFDATNPIEIAPDGADGPGIRIRTGGNGKVYGPYIDASKFKLGNPAAPISPTTGQPAWDSATFKDATLLDINGNSILYYPATPGAVSSLLFVKDVAPAGNANPIPAAGRPVYNAYDNENYGQVSTAGFILSAKQMEYILGDRNEDGMIDNSEQPATSLPYLLWTAGADGHFGFGIDTIPSDPNFGLPIDPATWTGGPLKTDDIANFDIPADLRK